MKLVKLFNVVGLSPDYVPLRKCDIFGIGSAAQAAASLAVAEKNYRAQMATNEMNYRIAKETNQANRELWREQNAAQIAQWNRENEYNSPAHQAALLAQGGFNPALAYDGGSAQAGSVTLGSPAPAVGATMQAPQFSDINIAGIVSTMADASKGFAEAEGQRLGNQYINAEKEKELALKSASISQMMESTKLTKDERIRLGLEMDKTRIENSILQDTKDDIIQGRRLDNTLKSAQTKVAEAQEANIRQNTLLQKAQEAFQIDENSRQWSRLSKEIQTMDAQISLMASQGRLNMYNCAKVFNDTVGSVLDNNQKAKLLPFVLNQYKNSVSSQVYENYILQNQARWSPFTAANGAWNVISQPVQGVGKTVMNMLMKRGR